MIGEASTARRGRRGMRIFCRTRGNPSRERLPPLFFSFRSLRWLPAWRHFLDSMFGLEHTMFYLAQVVKDGRFHASPLSDIGQLRGLEESTGIVQ